MPMNISTKFHACIRMCMIIVISRSTNREYLQNNCKKIKKVDVFLHIFTVKTLNSPFSYTEYLHKNGVSIKLSNVITSQSHNRMQCFREQKDQRNAFVPLRWGL